MKDALGSIGATIVIIGSFLIWCFGISVCWRADELFWAVVSFTFPPVGFFVGLFNLFF